MNGAAQREAIGEPATSGGLAARLRASEAEVARLRCQLAVLRRAARADPLTGLANRAHLDERLRQALSRAARRGTPVGLLMLDLNDFKRVNDTFGHAAGDAVLREVAVQLGSCTRPEDTIARYGGDEFVVLIEDVAGGPGAEAAVAGVARRLGAAVRVRVNQAVVTASVGYAVGDGRRMPADLVREADAAMYRAKRARRPA